MDAGLFQADNDAHPSDSAFFAAQEQLAAGIMRLKAFDEEALQSEGIDRIAKLLIGLKESGEVLVRCCLGSESRRGTDVWLHSRHNKWVQYWNPCRDLMRKIFRPQRFA